MDDKLIKNDYSKENDFFDVKQYSMPDSYLEALDNSIISLHTTEERVMTVEKQIQEPSYKSYSIGKPTLIRDIYKITND